MHRCLRTAELLGLILDHVACGSLSDLSSMAQVCSSLSAPALDIMWGDFQTSLVPLLHLLPVMYDSRSRLVVSVFHGFGQRTLIKSIQKLRIYPSDTIKKSLGQYSNRMKCLKIGSGRGQTRWRLDPTLFLTIMGCGMGNEVVPMKSLFGKLESFSCHPSGRDFTSRGHMGYGFDIGPSFIQGLSTLPRLGRLNLECPVGSPSFSSTASVPFSSLTSIHLSGTPKFICAFTDLFDQRLRLETVTLLFHVDFDDLLQEQHLVELAKNFIQAYSGTSEHLQRLEVGVDLGDGNWENVFEESELDDDEEFDIGLLNALLTFPALKTLKLNTNVWLGSWGEDFSFKVEGWCHRLTVLELGELTTSDRLPSITLWEVQHLVSHLPTVKWFRMPFVVNTQVGLSLDRGICAGVESLGWVCSGIDEAELGIFGSMFRRAFPSLQQIQVLNDHVDVWEKVSEIIHDRFGAMVKVVGVL
jgi:hypothetical protein